MRTLIPLLMGEVEQGTFLVQNDEMIECKLLLRSHSYHHFLVALQNLQSGTSLATLDSECFLSPYHTCKEIQTFQPHCD